MNKGREKAEFKIVTDHTATNVALRAEHLVKHFRVGRGGAAVHAVEDVSFDLRFGEVVALVGESGSGKSTVARLLAGLMRPTDGSILLNGEPIRVRRGRSLQKYCSQVQMILQDPFASLNPTHSVRYHLSRPLRIHQRAGRRSVEQAVFDLLRRVHLTPPETYIGKLPHELSGGQRQRVAIARALGPGPRVLLADEPVSMLDVSIRLGLLGVLEELHRELGMAILYITHDIASARYFAQRMMVMYAGQLVEGGPSEEVTQRAAHPYTKLLIESAPDPGRLTDPQAESTDIKDAGTGDPPSLISPPSGCRFHERCPFAMDRCRTLSPPPLEVGDGHWAACWLHAEGGGR